MLGARLISLASSLLSRKRQQPLPSSLRPCYCGKALDHNSLADTYCPHINWRLAKDIDDTPLSQLAKWASDLETWTKSGKEYKAAAPETQRAAATRKEALEYASERILMQYEEMKHHSPVPTLNLAAQLIRELRRYLEVTQLQMHKLPLYYHDGDYHRSMILSLDKWAGPVEGCFQLVSLYGNKLSQSKTDRSINVSGYESTPTLDPLSNCQEDLRKLCDGLARLSEGLASTKEALLPQLDEIEHMARTGRMRAPNMLDVYSPANSRSPSGFIKIRDEQGRSADLFVSANADFRNDKGLSNRLGSSSLTQIKWLSHRLSGGQYHLVPDFHTVELPKAAWHTVLRVAAVLRPHCGRQANIGAILNKPGSHIGVQWLEMEIDAFFKRNPGIDPVQLLDRQMGLDLRPREPTSSLHSICSGVRGEGGEGQS